MRPLGAGGMGAVWIARHHGLGSDVVVKFIAPQLAQNAEALARFQREAAAAAEVRSPHVVQTLDHGLTTTGVPYIAMELLEGESLRERIDRAGRLSPALVVTVVAHCAKALARAHERGVVHRDIKPDNIFLTDGGDGEVFAKVLDFGIAKSGNASLVATSTGAVLGSPYYMSPEQVLGSKAVDARTDLWALGVTTYEALTGRRPFEGETIGALSVAICHGTPPAPSQVHPGLPAAFDAWFAKACAREAASRFTSAKEMSDALVRALAGAQPVHAHTPDANARTLPMSTTAGLGVQSAMATGPQRRSRIALAVAAVTTVGALGGVAAWTLSRDHHEPTSAQPTEPAEAPTQPLPKKSSAAAAAPSEVIDLSSVPMVDAGPVAPSKPAAPAAKFPSTTASAKPSASPTALSSAVKPIPKVEHDPNIF